MRNYQKWMFGAALFTAGMFAINGTLADVKAAETVSTQIAAQDGAIALTAENFPDSWVLQAVKNYDTDGDGALSETEASAVTTLTLEADTQFHGIEQLRYFKNLKKLQIGTLEQPFIYDEPLDFTGFSKLEQLLLYRETENSDIDVSGLSKLKKVIIENTDEGNWNDERIDLTDTPALKNVRISSAGYAVFDEKTAIKKLYIYGSEQTSIHSLKAFPEIEWFQTSGIDKTIKTLDFTDCKKLKVLKLYAPEVETIILPKSLTSFTFDQPAWKTGKQLQTLDTSAATELRALLITKCGKLELPDLSSNQKLKRLSLECLMPMEADFSANQELASVYLCNYGEISENREGGAYSFAECKKLIGLSLKNVDAGTLLLPQESSLINVTLENMKYLKTLDAFEQQKLETLKLKELPALKKIRWAGQSEWERYQGK